MRKSREGEQKQQNRDRQMTKIVGGKRRKRERGKETTQGHTETRHREVAEHVGTVQYVFVKDKRVGMQM